MANITFDDVMQILKTTKFHYDLKEDINFYNENISALRSGNFEQIKNRLNQSMNKYGTDISQLSCLTNIEVRHYPVLTYEVAFSSLAYITNNIPFYVIFDKLKEKGLEFVLNKFFSGVEVSED